MFTTEKNHQRFVEMFDPEFEFIKSLGYTNIQVYQIRKNNTFYILKCTDTKLKWESDHLDNERRILKVANHVRGITHLVQDYGFVEKYTAVLKEFAEGNELQTVISDESIKTQLENIVQQFHSLGISCVDLCRKNLIINPFKKISLIDLGAFIKNNSLNIPEYNKNYDFYSLNLLLSNKLKKEKK